MLLSNVFDKYRGLLVTAKTRSLGWEDTFPKWCCTLIWQSGRVHLFNVRGLKYWLGSCHRLYWGVGARRSFVVKIKQTKKMLPFGGSRSMSDIWKILGICEVTVGLFHLIYTWSSPVCQWPTLVCGARVNQRIFIWKTCLSTKPYLPAERCRFGFKGSLSSLCGFASSQILTQENIHYSHTICDLPDYSCIICRCQKSMEFPWRLVD